MTIERVPGNSHIPASQDTTAVPGNKRVYFGGKPDSADLKGAQKMGLFELGKTLFEYFRKAENKQIVKAFAYQHAVPMVALVSGPFGWLFGVTIGPFIIKRGEKIEAELVKQGLDKTRGPLARAMLIKNLWDKAPNDAVPQIISQWNQSVDELLVDQEHVPKIREAAQRLKLKSDGNVAHLLNRMFHTRRYYQNRFLGKVMRGFNWVGNKLRILKGPMRLLSLGLQGLLMLVSWNKVGRIISKVR